MDNNGINFLAAMGNCQFYPNAGPSAADVLATMSNNNESNNDMNNENVRKNTGNGNSHQGHMNNGNNNATMNTNSAMASARNENESSTASANGIGAGNNNCDGSNSVTTNKSNANADDQQQQQQQSNRWNETSQMTHSHENGNASHHANNNDRIQNSYGQISTTPAPPPSAQQSNALWTAFHNSRNPWHFNGIPSCYQRLYSENSNGADAQTHYPYHHHHHHHHLQHIDHNVMKSASNYAQNSYQGLFHCIPTCL